MRGVQAAVPQQAAAAGRAAVEKECLDAPGGHCGNGQRHAGVTGDLGGGAGLASCAAASAPAPPVTITISAAGGSSGAGSGSGGIVHASAQAANSSRKPSAQPPSISARLVLGAMYRFFSIRHTSHGFALRPR